MTPDGLKALERAVNDLAVACYQLGGDGRLRVMVPRNVYDAIGTHMGPPPSPGLFEFVFWGPGGRVAIWPEDNT